MRMTSLFLGAGVFAACAGAPGAGVAADNCSGHYVNAGSRSVSISSDPAEPSHVMIGECQSGLCIRRDSDGDEMTTRTARTPGEYLGTWKVVSGTGKYARATRSGWFRPTRTDGEIVVGEWGGDCR